MRRAEARVAVRSAMATAIAGAVEPTLWWLPRRERAKSINKPTIEYK